MQTLRSVHSLTVNYAFLRSCYGLVITLLLTTHSRRVVVWHPVHSQDDFSLADVGHTFDFCDSTWVENHWFWDPGGNLCLEIVPDRLRNYFGCIGDQVLQVITLSESSISSRFADSEGELRNFKVNISHICTTSFRSPETRLPALHLLRIRYCTQMVNSFGFQYVCSWMMTSNRKIAFLGNVFFHTNPQFKFCFVEVKPCL